MMTYLLNCTPRITDVRSLRAAAFTPYVVGLTLLVLAVPLSFALGNKMEAARFLAASIALFVARICFQRT